MADGIVNDEVNTIAIKVPPFSNMPQKPGSRTWKLNSTLRSLQPAFTKFYYCISDLPSNVSAHLTHMIWDPGDDPYQEIKDGLIHL